MITFEKPIGSHADCKELEYISALHQTGPTIRQDASITAEDVANFLVSRHGIRVELKYIEENVMPGLAGAMDENPDAVFDIAEIVSMLLIPHLRKVGSGDDPDGLFDQVVKMILLDVNGSIDPVPLDRSMMKKIMSTYGEEDVSSAVLDEMLIAAGIPSPDTVASRSTPILLDGTLLCQATTHDILQYDVEWEDKVTTYYDDALDGTALDANFEDNDPEEDIAKSNFDDAGNQVKRIPTAPTIDFVAENFRAKTFNVGLWVLVVVGFYAYAFEFNSGLGQQSCTKFQSEFGCRVVNSIISWMIIMAQLVILGTIFVSLSTAGNSIYLQHNFLSFSGVILGIFSITASCILSYVFEFKFFLINTNKSDDFERQYAYHFALILGCFLLLFQIKALFYVMISRSTWKTLPYSNFWLTCEMAKTESANKKAASRKIDNMVKNALSKHSGSVFDDVKDARMKLRKASMKSAFGNAMLNFQATVDHREQIGGFFYTFRKIWDGSLFSEEGIYIHSRLYAMNMSQVFVVIFFMAIYAGLDYVIQYFYNPGTQAPTASPYPTMSPAPSASIETLVAQNLEYFNTVIYTVMSVGSVVFSAVWNNITLDNPEFALAFLGGLVNASSPEVIEYLASQLPPETLELFVNVVNKTESIGGAIMNTTRRTLESSYENYHPSRHLQVVEAVTDWLPSESEARIALSFGGIAAIFASISLALVWIPSSVNTIQMLRCGEISSLRDQRFQTYRSAPDLVTILFGSTFWGTIYSCGSLLAMVAFGALIVVWRATREFMLSILANVIGIVVTLLFKIILLIFIRKMLFVGFFRTQPLGGNILLLMLECWSLGLTVGTMLLRFVKIMVVSSFYVGRLDTPLFAPGVGCIGPIVLDSHPIEFRKDLLIHEAHRHPYMERLAVIYLLKLRYGKEFGTRAGGQWRLIFVLALMPWLRRYRLEDGLEYDVEDSKEMIVEQSKDDTIEVKRNENASIMPSKMNVQATDEFHA